MGRIKTQRETRDFSMVLVIKTYQNNNKKHRNFFGEGPDLSIYFGGGGGGSVLFFIFFYYLKNLFEEMVGGTIAPAGPPPSVSVQRLV
jgi:hypothetical protein